MVIHGLERHSEMQSEFDLLLFPEGAFFLVDLSRPGDVVLRLRQEILALPRLDGRPGQVVLHAISVDCQVLEIPANKMILFAPWNNNSACKYFTYL